MPRAAGDKRRQKQKPRRTKPRPDSTARGYDRRWEHFSRRYRLAHPVCVKCEQVDVTTASQVVDHIRPHRGNPALMYDANNLQALCKFCHDTKTGIESRYPVDWPQRDGLVVVSGLPGVGKSYYANANFRHVFDMGAEAAKRGMGSYPRLPDDAALLQRLREDFVAQYDNSGVVDSVAIIVTWPSEAHRIARRIRAQWLHLTCSTDARERRIAQRDRARWHEAAPAMDEHKQWSTPPGANQ